MKKALSYILIVVVAFFLAVNYELFVLPNSFAPAGINGICTMIQYMFGISIGYLNILINIPLAVFIYFVVSKPMALRSMIYTLSFSLFILLLERIDLSPFAYSTQYSVLLGPVVAGIISGAGAALIFKANTCLGGTDFIAAIIHKYMPQVNFFWAIFVLNALVAGASFFVYDYKIEPVILCILYSYSSTAVRDNIMQKGRCAVRCEIITEHPHELGQALIHKLHHSATLISAKGMYSGKEKSILICIVNRSQVGELSHVVMSFPDSFVIVSHVTNVLGNFRRLDSHGKPEVELFDIGSGHSSDFNILD